MQPCSAETLFVISHWNERKCSGNRQDHLSVHPPPRWGSKAWLAELKNAWIESCVKVIANGATHGGWRRRPRALPATYPPGLQLRSKVTNRCHAMGGPNSVVWTFLMALDKACNPTAQVLCVRTKWFCTLAWTLRINLYQLFKLTPCALSLGWTNCWLKNMFQNFTKSNFKLL